jgi:hypothetical protein
VPRSWILQANPVKWRVWDWWNETDEPLDRWTISQRLGEVHAGDNFALWIGGRDAGVYAMGKVTSTPQLTTSFDGFWAEPPTVDTYAVELETTRYLFDAPVLKPQLRSDPDFENALILRMPRTANPVPLTSDEWRALRRHVGRQGHNDRPDPAAEPVVTTRRIGDVQEDVDVAAPEGGRRRAYSESRLVKEYERFLGRELAVRPVRLPSKERLVCDAFDEQENLLIEAKSSVRRQDIRMAIGQLFDYRRYMGSGTKLAILLPERPSDDLLALLRDVKVQVIVRDDTGFATVN